MWPVLKVAVFCRSSLCVCIRFHTDVDAVQMGGAFSTGCHNWAPAILHSCILYNVHMSVYNFPFLFLSCFWETLCCLHFLRFVHTVTQFCSPPQTKCTVIVFRSSFVCLFFDCISLIHFCCLFCIFFFV